MAFDILYQRLRKFVDDRIKSTENKYALDFNKLFVTLMIFIEVYKIEDWIVEEICHYLCNIFCSRGEFVTFDSRRGLIATILKYICRIKDVGKDFYDPHDNSIYRGIYNNKVSYKNIEKMMYLLKNPRNLHHLLNFLYGQIKKFVEHRINFEKVLKNNKLYLYDLFMTLTMCIEKYKPNAYVVDTISQYLFTLFCLYSDCSPEDNDYEKEICQLLKHLDDKQLDKASYDQHRSVHDLKQCYENYKVKKFEDLTEEDKENPNVLIDYLLAIINAWSSYSNDEYPEWYKEGRKKIIREHLYAFLEDYFEVSWLIDEVCEAFLSSDTRDKEALKYDFLKHFEEFLGKESVYRIYRCPKPIAAYKNKEVCLYY